MPLTPPPGTNNNSGVNINQAVIDSSVIHTNVGQEIVITTEDKLDLCLRDHQDILKAKTDWKTPAGLFLAFLTSLVAADFKDFGFNSETWFSIFLVLCIICGGWLSLSLKKAYDYKNSGNISQIIQKLKNNSQNLSNTP